MAANTDSSVTLTFRVREQVTPALSRMESGLGRVSNAASNTGKFLGQNALQMVAVGSAMVAGAGAAAQLAVRLGILNEEQGKTAASFIQGAGAVVAVVGGLSQLGVFLGATGAGAGILALGKAMTTAAGGAAALTGSLAALMVVGGALVAFSDLVPNIADRLGQLTGLGIPNAPESIRQFASRGSGLSPTRDSVAGRQLDVVIRTFAATESELRGAAKTLGRILQEENRIGGFQIR